MRLRRLMADTKMPSTVRGELSEMRAIEYFLREGWLVFRNVSRVGTPDLMIYHPDGMVSYRVEVKTINSSNSISVREDQHDHADIIVAVSHGGKVVILDDIRTQQVIV
jgi:hypothetical protein